MVDGLHNMLKSGVFSKFGIGLNSYYFITDKNRNIYNLICRFYRDNYITEKSEIYTYYFDDTIEALSTLINNKKFIYDEEFFSISDINKLPDLRLMILSGNLNIKDIVKIIKNKHISNFRKWFFNIADNGDEIEKEFKKLSEFRDNKKRVQTSKVSLVTIQTALAQSIVDEPFPKHVKLTTFKT